MATDSYCSERSGSPESNGDRGSDRGSREVVTLRFIANSREVGSIIGKKGDNVKKVREESGARVNISDASSPERIVTIAGSTGEAIRAFSMICAKFEQDGQSIQSDASSTHPQVLFRLVIPNSHCGSLIGKSGSNIKELREVTGATIQVANEMLPNSNERAVTISGPIDSVMKCIQRLCTIAIETKPKGPNIPYQPQKLGYGTARIYNEGRTGYSQPRTRNDLSRQMIKGQSPMCMMMGEMSSLHSNQGALSNSYLGMYGGYGESGRIQTHEIMIPNHTIGSIIGKQGSRINGIRQSSQALIKIADLEEGSTDRKVTITGSPASISSALYLINGIQARYGSPPAGKHL